MPHSDSVRSNELKNGETVPNADLPVSLSDGEVSALDGTAPHEYVVTRPFPWQLWLELAIVVLILAWIIYSLIKSGVVSLTTIREFLISKDMALAVWRTLYLATLATFIALFLGIGIALMRVSGNQVVSSIAAVYVYVFRGTPMLIQLIFWFNAMPVIIPFIHLHFPFTGIVLLNTRLVDVITPFLAALLGLSLAEAGYMAEVMRSGMSGVDRGQRDAARALGITEQMIQFKIVIPQGLRLVVPSIGNEYITMLKNTSLASIIGYVEILRRTTDIYTSNFHVMELLAVAAFWYLMLTSLVSHLQHMAERKFPTG